MPSALHLGLALAPLQSCPPPWIQVGEFPFAAYAPPTPPRCKELLVLEIGLNSNATDL